MSGQGDYYYSSPLLQVQQWSMRANGARVGHGRGGTLWLDNVEQSFDAAAEKVVKNGVTWTEFTTPLPRAGSPAPPLPFMVPAAGCASTRWNWQLMPWPARYAAGSVAASLPVTTLRTFV